MINPDEDNINNVNQLKEESETINISDLNHAHDYLERQMSELPAKKSKENHRCYLCGCIETMYEFGIISETIKEKLYSEYCF